MASPSVFSSSGSTGVDLAIAPCSVVGAIASGSVVGAISLCVFSEAAKSLILPPPLMWASSPSRCSMSKAVRCLGSRLSDRSR
ncbi:MAG: hypothetical protein RLP02_15690 [Coleofasciculus sp. C2-GNP5-27]